MGSLKVLLLFGCAGLIFAYDTMSDHLDEKLRQTKIEIAKIYFREDPPVERKLYNVKWDRLWHQDFDKKRPFIVNTFDKIVLMKGNRFVAFSVDTIPRNDTLSKDFIFPANDNPIKFVRSIVWKSVIYLLTCYGTGSCDVQTGTDYNQLQRRQIIQHKGYPMDASFFVSANRLYLVVADNSGLFVVPSLIYHWTGTYMDVIAEVMTTAAVSVTTFRYKQSTIIIFVQNDGKTPGIGSMVYEFEDGTADRIQFLPTSNPTSVHHYSHAGFNFILLVNQHGPSSLYWWDGHELLSWEQIAEIQAPSSVHIVNINDDAFFLVGYNNTVQLYKFGNTSDCTLLNSMELPNNLTLVDVQLKIAKNTIIMVLVVMDKNNTYNVELWKIHMEEIPTDGSTNESDVLSKNLAELIDILQQRKSLIDKAEASLPLLLPANENLTASEPLVLQNMILDSGTVRNINVFADEDIMAPRELEEQLKNLMADVNDVLTVSKELLTLNNMSSLNGDIVIKGDAVIEQLQVDKLYVDFLNDVDMQAINVTNPQTSQQSSNSLKGNNITVQDLKADSICGIPFNYWSLNNDTSKMDINVGSDKIEFSGDTVHLYSNVSLTNLTVNTINGTNINELFSELFIIHENQKIKGNITYTNALQIQNLTIQMLNGIPWENYMNTVTDQNFKKFIIRKLQVENLYADSINGVPVSGAARISTENVIKGEAKIAKLIVTEKFTADPNIELPVTPPYQIYNNVTIRGNLHIGTLDLDKYTNILINGEQIDLNNILDTFWTKSSDQTIENDVAFENSLIIDYLNTKYFNGFTEEEFLYTNATIIPENFTNLHFENVHVDDMFFVAGENDSFFEIAPESITIRERLHLEHLHGNQLFTEVFNGVPITEILNGTRPYIFAENMYFPTIRAKQVNVDELNFQTLNNESSFSLLKNAKNDHKDQPRKFMKTSVFHVKHLRVETINGLEMEKLQSLKNINISDLKNLVINGDVTIRGDLNVNRIDDQSPMTYLQNMFNQDIVIDTKMTFDELIVQNVTLRSLNGHDANNLFERLLSKSKDQVVPGQFSFYKVTTNNTETKFINDQDTSKIMWITEPLFLTGNVTFDDLFVEGDIITSTLNDRDVNELYQSMLNVSVKEIGNLTIDGNISWANPSNSSTSLTFLFNNAVTKATNQTIPGDTIFRKDVSASTVTGRWKEIDEIHEIIADAVIDDGDVIELTGKKMFKENLVISSLSVTGDISIPTVNGINILEFNNSVARRGAGETINGTITFLEEATINKIIVDDGAHNIPFKDVVLATDMLPPGVVFRDLELKDAFVKNLDGINFDEFLKDRVTIDGNYKILADVQFNGDVVVTGNANVSRINGIDPSDMVLNGTRETQWISGSKIFEEDVIVNGNIYAPFVNGMNVSAEYSNGIQNDEDVEFVGDLIFKTMVKVPENVSVSDRVNGIKLQTIVNDLQNETRQTIQTLKQKENRIEEIIAQSSLISETLRNIFSYVEVERSLKVHAPNIKKVHVVYYEQVVKLNLFGEEPGNFCGLPNNCSCPTVYVAELDEHGCRITRTNGSKIVRNYHEPHSTFGVNVITNSVSYSPECTLNNTEDEFIKISWMKSVMVDTGEVFANMKETSSEIQGFVKDAETFMTHDNSVFVILAVYYDTLHATHHTNSTVYKIDFEKNALTLHQQLPTDGAWALEVFKINHHEIYLLLGCFGGSEKSYLYKMDSISAKFTLQKTFGGKTRNVKSLFQEQDHFILLDDFDTNAINIYHYDREFDNFYSYQSLFHSSRISSVECFYADELGQSDSFIIVATENNKFYIYEYMYAQKFQLKLHHPIDDLQTMVPFHYSHNHYIFTGTRTNSTILRIVKQGPH